VNPLLGGAAGLATAFLWACSALAWGLAGRRVHSLSIAAIRILLATVILAAVHSIAFGWPWPRGLDFEPVLFLALSGLAGMTAGDICYFRGITIVGPRLATLLFSLCPLFTTLIAWATRGETLSVRMVCGIVLNVGGVAWACSDPAGRSAWPAAGGRKFREGVILILIGTAFIAGGYVLSKMGMAGGARRLTEGAPLAKIDPFQGTFIRVLAGAAATWAFLPMMGKLRPTVQAMSDRRAMLTILVGTIVGPVVGVWTSMIAIANVPSGVASSLIGCSPIFMIPLSRIVFGERHTARSLVGTLAAIGGVFLLLW